MDLLKTARRELAARFAEHSLSDKYRIGKKSLFQWMWGLQHDYKGAASSKRILGILVDEAHEARVDPRTIKLAIRKFRDYEKP